jgi:hypothetical protein
MSDPFVSKPVGSPAISPGRSVFVPMSLPPGTYALVTFVFDIDGGVLSPPRGCTVS